MKECYETLAQLRKDRSFKGIFHIMCGYGPANAAEYIDRDGLPASVTYAEYEQRALAVASHLASRLEERGAVGIKLENSPDWPAIFWGVMMSGNWPVLLDARAPGSLTLHLLDESGAVAIVTEESEEYPGYARIAPAGLLSGAVEPGFTPVWEDRVAVCTSGTTGTARVFVYDGKAMSAQMDNAQYFLDENPDIMYDTADGPCKNLAFLPLHHIFGFVAVYMWYSFFGKTVVYLADKNPKTIMETCRELEVTHIFCVPMFWNSVAQGIARKAKLQGKDKLFERMSRISYSLQSGMKHTGRKVVAGSFFRGIQNELVGTGIRFLINGGGHILPETLRAINSVGYPLYNGFGMTEAGITSVEFTSDIALRVQGSVGKPFASVEYRIDAPDGADAGELLINGASLHTGRMVDGEFIPRDKNEWFATGDIARIQDGRLWLEGRLKEVIIDQSGENIYPDELEDYFINLPGVAQHCVFGMDTGRAYEEIVMVLELEDGADHKSIGQLAEAIEEINGNLPLSKKLAKVYVSSDALPLANGIKVQRQKLKKLLEQDAWRYRSLDLTTRQLSGPEDGRAPAAATSATGGVDADKLAAIKEEVRKIFAEVLILEEKDIGDFDHFVTDLGGDSLAVIGVISQLEEKYDVFIPDAEFEKAVNVQDIALLLYGKLHGETAGAPASSGPAAPEPARSSRITDFEQTSEYAELQARFAQCAGADNPYFVAHDSAIRDTSVVDGREVINLGAYNYLGMSGHPETKRAAIAAIEQYGTSASGSRTLAGEKTLFQELEEAIARWKHTESAIVLTGGHATNVTFIGNFCGEGDLILYDALSHNSIVQGCKLSSAESKSFPHNDISALEQILRSVQGRYTKVLIVVEGVYSMDGDIAPIPEFVRLRREYGCFLMVDEAHSSGVIGERGGGVDDYFSLAPDDVDIKMGTLSKALGCCGGYIAASRAIVDYLKYSLPGFVFTAGISPPLAAACKRAVELLQEDPSIVARLHANIAHFIQGAKARGFDTMRAAESAIVPVFVGEDAAAFSASRHMLERGIFVPPAVFPAVARGQSRLRFSISAAHSFAQLDAALDALSAVGAELGFRK